MTAEDDTIAIAIIKPQDWIDESACVAAVGLCVIEERQVRESIHNIIDVSQGEIVPKTAREFRRVIDTKPQENARIRAGMSGGLNLMDA